MSEPGEKKRRIGDDIQLEPFPQAVNARLVTAVRAFDSAGIRRALDEGAQSNLQIDNEPLVRYMVRSFREIHTAPQGGDDAAAPTLAEWKALITSVAQFPNADRELGEDWQFFLWRHFNFQDVFNIKYNYKTLIDITPRWIDHLMNTQNIPINLKNRTLKLLINRLHYDSSILHSLNHPHISDIQRMVLINYPVVALQYIHHLIMQLVLQFDKMPARIKLALCSLEPRTAGGYSETYKTFYRQLTRLGSAGFYMLVELDVPINQWWDFINIYLNGIKAMRGTDFEMMIPFVTETEVVPIAGHLERVKFFPQFRDQNLLEMLAGIRESLERLAKLCHIDQDVRNALREAFRSPA